MSVAKKTAKMDAANDSLPFSVGDVVNIERAPGVVQSARVCYIGSLHFKGEHDVFVGATICGSERRSWREKRRRRQRKTVFYVRARGGGFRASRKCDFSLFIIASSLIGLFSISCSFA